jgi:hypothetical protein
MQHTSTRLHWADVLGAERMANNYMAGPRLVVHFLDGSTDVCDEVTHSEVIESALGTRLVVHRADGTRYLYPIDEVSHIGYPSLQMSALSDESPSEE